MKQVEIQLSPLGSYIKDGETFEITPELVANAVSYFDATRKASGQDLVIDYEHQSLTGQTAPAAGWIKELVNKGTEGLYALVEWTDKASEYIKGKEYKYISPVLVYGYEDEKTGTKMPMVLFNAALTNTPFLPDIKEVVAKKHANFYINSIDITNQKIIIGSNTMDVAEMLKSIATAAGLAATATAEEVMAQVKRVTDFMKSIPAATGAAPTAEGGEVSPEDAMVMAKDAMACTRDLKKLLKIDGNGDAITSAVLALTAKAQPEDDNAKIVELTQKLEKMERAEGLKTLIASNPKRISPAHLEFITDAYMDNPDRAIALVAKMPELDLTTPIIKKEKAQDDTTITPEEKKLIAKLGTSEAAFLAGKKVKNAQKADEED